MIPYDKRRIIFFPSRDSDDQSILTRKIKDYWKSDSYLIPTWSYVTIFDSRSTLKKKMISWIAMKARAVFKL